MNNRHWIKSIILGSMLLHACTPEVPLDVTVLETSAGGHQLTEIADRPSGTTNVQLTLFPDTTYQTITGFGGSFTEASAYLLNQLSAEKRQQVLEAYFSESGAHYSLTRTHINSCDFSLSNYSYAPIPGDTALDHFSIDEDRPDLIPMIRDAMAISPEGFRIIASPWTAPPWMKDNNDWRGGKLLPEYYDTWAHFFSKYLHAYRAEGIPIWGITVENEPLGNDSNWESMHYTPEDMNRFVKNHLGPRLEADGHDVVLMGYDQNRGAELRMWVDAMYQDQEAARYYDGTAVHWYESTYDWFPEALQYAHQSAPDKHLIHSEGCVDAEIPKWQDDAWYWSKEATDWGYTWAPEDKRYLHPKYVPVYRYARDIIGCLNNWVDGWVDWNMVLNRQGGPNWAENWCVAPVIVDEAKDEVYFTPLYYTMAHFSKYIRPGARRIGFELSEASLMATAARNPDGSIAVVVLNQQKTPMTWTLTLAGRSVNLKINGAALQTILLNP